MEFDRVDLFDKISVRIPRTWVETSDEEPNTYGFFDPAGDLGTLRVSLFTNKRDLEFTPEMLMQEAFDAHPENDVRFLRRDDLVIAQWEQMARRKADLYMYYWAVSAQVGPQLTRQALFLFAVALEDRAKPDFEATLRMIEECVYAVHFIAQRPN